MEGNLHFSTVTTGFVKNGPGCYCGHNDWFIGQPYRCSHCDRTRDKLSVFFALYASMK